MHVHVCVCVCVCVRQKPSHCSNTLTRSLSLVCDVTVWLISGPAILRYERATGSSSSLAAAAGCCCLGFRIQSFSRRCGCYGYATACMRVCVCVCARTQLWAILCFAGLPCDVSFIAVLKQVELGLHSNVGWQLAKLDNHSSHQERDGGWHLTRLPTELGRATPTLSNFLILLAMRTNVLFFFFFWGGGGGRDEAPIGVIHMSFNASIHQEIWSNNCTCTSKVINILHAFFHLLSWFYHTQLDYWNNLTIQKKLSAC